MLWSTILFAAFAEAIPQLNLPRGLNHLRFGCSQITIERLDPLVNPGLVGTPHTHQVVGGDAFKPSMPSSDISKIASCTTCGPADDLSNYWTANLYFKARNGTYKRVPQVPNRYTPYIQSHHHNTLINTSLSDFCLMIGSPPKRLVE